MLKSGRKNWQRKLSRRRHLYQDSARRMGCRYGTQADQRRPDARRKTADGKIEQPGFGRQTRSFKTDYAQIQRFQTR